MFESLLSIFTTCSLCGRSFGQASGFCPRCQGVLQEQVREKHWHWLNQEYQCLSVWPMNQKTYQLHRNQIVLQKDYLCKKWRAWVVKELLKLRVQRNIPIPNNGLIVPVPSTSGRRHSHLLAKSLSGELKLPFEDRLQPLKQTQKLKNRKERLEVRFELKSGFSKTGRPVILVDDLLTTGASARACLEALGNPKSSEIWTIYRLDLEACSVP